MINYFIKKIPHIVTNFLSSTLISLDLGTKMTRLAIADKGIVVREPTVLGYNQQTKNYLFFGKEAKEIIGKTPEFIKIIKPIHHAVINDFDSTLAFLNNLIENQLYPHYRKNIFFKPFSAVCTSIASNTTEIEKKALEEVLTKLGFNKILIIDKPVALMAAIKDNVLSHSPLLLVDLGGGLTEISIVSGGGVLVNRSLKTAGEFFLQQISHYLYLKYGVILGDNTNEQLLINLLNFSNEDKLQVVRGKSLETGLPKSVRVKTADIREALTSALNSIIDMIREVIEFSPPEAVDEIYKNGIFLSGGLANIKGIDTFFSKSLKIQTVSLEKPENTLINGLLKLSKQPAILQQLIK